MVVKLYERSIINEPVIETVIPTIEVPNIWVELADRQVEEIEEERSEKIKTLRRRLYVMASYISGITR